MTANLTFRRLGVGTVAAALVIVAIWYLALISPQSHKLAAARTAATASEQQVASLSQKVDTLKALQKVIPQDRAKLAQYLEAIPDQPDLSTVIRQIQAAAVASNVTVSSVSPTVPTTGSPSASSASSASPGGVAGVEAIPTAISATGSYRGVTTFVTALESIPRTFVIQSFSLSGSGNSMSASISADLYFTGAP